MLIGLSLALIVVIVLSIVLFLKLLGYKDDMEQAERNNDYYKKQLEAVRKRYNEMRANPWSKEDRLHQLFQYLGLLRGGAQTCYIDEYIFRICREIDKLLGIEEETQKDPAPVKAPEHLVYHHDIFDYGVGKKDLGWHQQPCQGIQAKAAAAEAMAEPTSGDFKDEPINMSGKPAPFQYKTTDGPRKPASFPGIGAFLGNETVGASGRCEVDYVDDSQKDPSL